MGKDLKYWQVKSLRCELECAEKTVKINELKSENKNLKNEIAKLKQHLKSKENLYENEEIPFADEQYEEDLLAELQDRHQQDCIEINELTVTLNKVIDMYSRLREQVGLK